MEPVLNSPIPLSVAWPKFTPISKLEQHKSTDTNLDILTIVIDTSPPRAVTGMYGTSNVQDLVLITDEKSQLCSTAGTTSSAVKQPRSYKLQRISPSWRVCVSAPRNSEVSHL